MAFNTTTLAHCDAVREGGNHSIYLVIDVNPEGTGKIRLAPITMTRVKSDRVTVRSLYSGQFDDIPQTASASVVTKLEEDKIMGWFGGGTMYADPKRAEPKL